MCVGLVGALIGLYPCLRPPLTVHVPQELVLQCALRLDDEQINHAAAIAARRAQLKSRPPELSRGAHEACTLACGVRRYEVGGVA